jgi:hypothetical protein
MAKTVQFELYASMSQAQFDGIAHSILFADSINPVWLGTGGSPDASSIIITSNVESEIVTGMAGYKVLADDSRSEVSIDIATGKFVEGNIIAGLAPLAEIQSDVRDFVTYNVEGSDLKLFVGVCSTTQSQDYTPDLVANSRVTKMLTPAQVKSLNL